MIGETKKVDWKTVIASSAIILLGTAFVYAFGLGSYKQRFEATEAQTTQNTSEIAAIKTEVTDRLARIETKLDQALRGN